jgi:hypothetical protein
MIVPLALLFAAPAAESSQPADLATTAMIIELQTGAKPTGVALPCPGDDSDPGVTHCYLREFEGEATVIRHLAGPTVKRLHKLRFESQQGRWAPGTRLLVWTQPSVDGGASVNVAHWWLEASEDGDFCVSEAQLSYWQHPPVRAVFEKARRRHFRMAADAGAQDFLCVTD